MELRLATVLFCLFGLLNAASLNYDRYGTSSSEQNVRNLLRDLCQNSIDDLTEDVPSQFNELVHRIRNLEGSRTKAIWRDIKSGALCSQTTKLQDFFRDALIMDGSQGSIEQLVELINGNEFTTGKVNYGLTMLAFVKEPTLGSIRALVPLLEKSDVPRQGLLGASAMINNYCRNVRDSCHNVQEVKEAVSAIGKHLGYKCKPENSENEDRVIVALKAIKNIGVVADNKQTIQECAADRSNPNTIRVAAVQALEGVADDKRVETSMWELLQDDKSDAEVRIAAYKNIMAGQPDRNTINRLKVLMEKEESKQVGSYIVSHLKNIEESSDPEKKQLKTAIRNADLPMSRFPQDWRKFSRNFQLANYYETFDFGSVVTADLIYNHRSFVPTSAELDVKLPIFGQQVNLLNIGARQVNLQKVLEAFSDGKWAEKRAPEVIKDLMSFFAEKNEIKRSRRSIPYSYRRLGLLQERAPRDQEDFDGSFYLNFDGKTIFYFEAKDLLENSVEDLKELVQETIKAIQRESKNMNVDRSFSMMFLDINREIQRENSSPLKIDVNGTLVAAFKGKDNAFFPSFAVELAGKVSPDTRNGKPGLRWVNTIYSAPSIKSEIEYKNGVPVKALFSFPKEVMTFFSHKSQVWEIDSRLRERPLRPGRSKNAELCTDSTEHHFGFKFCAKSTRPIPFFHYGAHMLPLNGPWSLDLTLEKTDKSMRGYEYILEFPRESSDRQLYKIGFNTPGSRVNREHKVEVELTSERDGQAVRFDVVSPKTSFQGGANYKWNSNEAAVSANVQSHSSNRYAVEAGFRKQKSGRIIEYRPRFTVTIPNREAISMDGSISLDNLRSAKPKILIDLSSGGSGDKKIYLRGELVRDGPITAQQFKLSTSLDGNFKLANFKIYGLAEKKDMIFLTNLDLDYQREGRMKHSVKLIGKAQDQQTAMRKVNTFFEIQMTQLPEYNFQVTQNFAFKRYEYFENELDLKWGEQFQDEQKNIHLLQLYKKEAENKYEARLLSEIKPLSANLDMKVNGQGQKSGNNFDFEVSIENQMQFGRKLKAHYELGASGNVIRGENPHFKFEVRSVNKVHNKNTKANFEYKHQSRKPLKLSMDAAIEYPGRRISYSDHLEEVRPHEFKGKTIFQWAPNKKTIIDYNYRKKVDSNQNQHDVELELQTPSMNIRHSALLRSTRYDWQVKSKHIHDNNEIYNAEATISSKDKSLISVNTQGFYMQLEGNPLAHVKTGDLKIKSNKHSLEHDSSILVQPGQYALNSKTLISSKPVFVISSTIKPRDNSLITLTAKDLRAKAEYSKRTGILKVNAKSAKAGMSLNGEYEDGKRAAIQVTANQINHDSEISRHAGVWKVASRTVKAGEVLVNLNSEINPSQKSFVNYECPAHEVSFEVNLAPVKSAKLSVKGKRNPYGHVSEGSYENGELTVKSNTKTRRNNYQIDSVISKRRPSTLNYVDNQNRILVVANPMGNKKSFKLDIDTQNVDFAHESTLDLVSEPVLNSKTNYNGKQIYQIKSVMSSSQPSLQGESQWLNGKVDADLAQTKKLNFDLTSKIPRERRILGSVQYTPGQLDSELSWDADRDRNQKVSLSAKHAEEASWRSKRYVTNVNAKYGDRYTYQLTSNLNNNLYEGPHDIDIKATCPRGQKVLTAHHDITNGVANTKGTLKYNNQVSSLESRLSQNSKSHVKLVAPQGKLLGEYEPNRMALIELDSNVWDHKTTLNRLGNAYTADSITKQNNRPVATINGQYSPSQTSASVKIPQGDARFKYNTGKDVELAVNSDNYRHKTTASKGNSIVFRSETLKNGRSVADIQGDMNWENAKLKCELPQGKFNSEYQRGRRAAVNVDAYNYNHASEVSKQRDTWKVTSKTSKAGDVILDLDSEVNPKRKSYVKTNCPCGEMSFEVSVAPVKNARLSVKSKHGPYSHVSEGSYENEELNFKSNTNTKRNNYHVEAFVSQRKPSSIKYNDRINRMTLIVAPLGNAKSLKLDLGTKNMDLSHESALDLNDEPILNSKTIYNRQQIYKVKSLMSGSRPSLEGESQWLSGKVDADLQSQTKKFNVDLTSKIPRDRRILGLVQYTPGQLDSEVSWDADRYPNQKVSVSAKHQTQSSWRNKRYISSLNAKYGNSHEYFVSSNLADNLYDGPHDIQVKTRCPRAERTFAGHHDITNGVANTKADYKDANQVASLESQLSRNSKSQVKINVPQGKALYEYEPNRMARIELNTDNWDHKTAFNKQRDVYEVDSVTKKDSQPIATLNGQYSPSKASGSFVIPEGNAKFNCNYGRDFDIEVNSDSFTHKTRAAKGRSYTFNSETKQNGQNIANIQGDMTSENAKLNCEFPQGKFNGEYQRNRRAAVKVDAFDYKHESEVTKNADTWKVDSKTSKSGRLLRNLDGELNPSKVSVNYECPRHVATFEVNVPQKNAKVTIRNKETPFRHNSEAKYTPYEATFNSLTETGNNKYEIEALVSKKQPSSFKYVDRETRFNALVNPQGSQKSVKVDFKNRKNLVNHESTLDLNDEPIMDSKTIYNGKQIYQVKAVMSTRKPSISGDSQWISGKVDANLDQNTQNLNIDLRSKVPRNRRILGSVRAIQGRKNEINSELSWDADRDNSQKVVIALSHEKAAPSWRNQKYVSSLNAKYGNQYSLDLKSDMAAGKLVEGPHEFEVRAATPSDQYFATAHHDISNGVVNCRAEAKKNGQIVATLNSRVSSNSKSQIDLRVPQGSASVEYEPRRSGKIELKSERYAHKTTVSKRNNDVVIESLTTEDRQPICTINGQISESLSKASVKIPHGDANIRILPWEEMELNVQNARRNMIHRTLLRKARAFEIESSTKLDNRELADINANLQSDDSKIRFITPKGHFKGEFKQDGRAEVDIYIEGLRRYLDDTMRYLSVKMKKSCDYYSNCHKIARSYDRSGFQGVKSELKRISDEKIQSASNSFGQSYSSAAGAMSRYTQRVQKRLELLGGELARYLEPITQNEVVQKAGNGVSSAWVSARDYVGDMSDKINEIQQSFAEYVMSIPTVSELLESGIEAFGDVTTEWEKVKNTAKDSVKFVSANKWNTEKGFIKVHHDDERVRLAIDTNKRPVLKAAVPESIMRTHELFRENLASLSGQVNYVKAAMNNKWLPPFRGQAMLIGGQHIVTFDKTFYDFAGQDCTYLLARDFNDGNFSVMAKYERADNLGRVKKTVVVNINNANIEIDPHASTVKLDDQIVDLPLRLSGVTVMRRGENIVVDDKRGVTVECQLNHDICTVAVSGWYFGKTGGLFGTYDYESYNDMRSPRGEPVSSANELASHWVVKESCRAQNVARNEEIGRGSAGYQQCEYFFQSPSSPLRSGFGVINPDKMFKTCLRHMAATKRYQNPEKSVCTMAQAYRKLLQNEGLNIALPTQCLTCDQNTEFGARRMLTRPYAAPKKADVIFVVEEHECNRHLSKDISSVARSVEKELIRLGYNDVKFGVTGFGGPQDLSDIHFHTARGEILFSSPDVALATERMQFRPRDDEPIDIYEAIAFASEYPFRAGASKNLVLMTCTACQEEEMRHDYSTIQQLLLTQGITMHILNDRPIDMKSSKARGVFAVDAQTVYRGKDVSQRKLVGEPDIRSQVGVPKDVCIALAQESRGAFFSTQAATDSESKRWRSLLARRIAESAEPSTCSMCYCIGNREGSASYNSCRPCKARTPATEMWNLV